MPPHCHGLHPLIGFQTTILLCAFKKPILFGLFPGGFCNILDNDCTISLANALVNML